MEFKNSKNKNIRRIGPALNDKRRHIYYTAQMTPQTKKFLEIFASSATWSTIALPQDMENFRDFIISAYKNGEFSITLDEFLEVLGGTKDMDIKTKKRTLSSKMFMFNQYEDGIKLLRKFEGSSGRDHD
ncbi:MAG: hypothetical protein WCT49_01360 [Candidatus Paceibacterota bacterium]|jgi:hypothetical protein|nr:hypothetical protein [Candidatus Paceibacterota bacterium]